MVNLEKKAKHNKRKDHGDDDSLSATKHFKTENGTSNTDISAESTIKKEEDNSSQENTTYNHSIKVPQFYKQAQLILKKFDNKEGSVKTLLYETKICRRPRDVSRMLSIVTKIVQNLSVIKAALNSSSILKDHPYFDPHMAMVLVGQLMIKGSVEGKCKPVVVFQQYQKKIREALQDKFNATARPKGEDYPRYVRINTLLSGFETVRDWLNENGYCLQEYDPSISYDDYLELVTNLTPEVYLVDYHVPELLLFHPSVTFYDCELYHKNVLILQDKGSCLPVVVSGVGERCNVIDACAAPGNKTTYIAAKMNNKGGITAIDRDAKRYMTLRNLVTSREASCVKVIHSDFLKLDMSNYCDVNYIFVDPTCSATGMDIHKDEISELRLRGLSTIQLKLLSYALSFPAVKVVMYSTCSVYEEENEGVVMNALDRHRDFELADLSKELPGWKHFGRETYSFGAKCLRTNTDVDRCTGFFIAKFVKKDNISNEEMDFVKQEKDEQLNEEETDQPNPEIAKDEEMVDVQKHKKKKKKNKEKDMDEPVETAEDEEIVDNLSEETPKKHKKKKKNKEKDMDEPLGTPEDEEIVDNLSEETPKKHKKKKNKEKDMDESLETAEDKEIVDNLSEETPKKHKKKRKNKEEDLNETTEVTEEELVNDLDEELTDGENKKKKKRKSK